MNFRPPGFAPGALATSWYMALDAAGRLGLLSQVVLFTHV